MNKNIKTIIGLLIILLLGIAFYYIKKDKYVPMPIVEPTDITAAPIEGCYVAHLAKDVYTLAITSEKNGVVTGMLAYNNYEKDSSSGSFTGTLETGILLGTYSFDSEGMHSERQVIFKKVGTNFVQGFGSVRTVGNKEVFSDALTITYDPKSTFVKVENCTEHFTDKDKTFIFDYNPFFSVTEGDKIPTTEWRVNTTDKGILLAQLRIPKGYMPQTNFGDAKFTVGRSTDPNVIKSCTNTVGVINQENKGEMVTQATISGYPFTKFTTGDAGAGNYYGTTAYRGIVDGDCYAIEYTIHSTSLGAYSPDQGIKEFDTTKIKNELEKIVKSFKFLVDSN